MTTKIEWTQETWNPVTGCTKISPGCQHCYAERMAKRLAGRYGYPKDEPFKPGVLHSDKLDEPLKWKKPRQVFVCSMGDLFHDAVPFQTIAEVFKVMRLAENHTFQVLTKRPQRMAEFIEWMQAISLVDGIVSFAEAHQNIWFGITAENQEQADQRIPFLLQIPVAVKFVSVEPMLSEVDIEASLYKASCFPESEGWRLDWIIVGGESGPGARPMHPEWARSIRDQCRTAKVPFFFKQWGEWISTSHHQPHMPSNHMAWPWAFKNSNGDLRGDTTMVFKVGKKIAGRLLDGREWNEMPCSCEKDKKTI